jgi:hypothetical protein
LPGESAAQAVEQQIPCTHVLLVQSVFTPHFCPLPAVAPQMFIVVLHSTPALQSVAAVAAVQLVRQVAPLHV